MSRSLLITILSTKDSAIAEEQRVNGRLHWRFSERIICSCTVFRYSYCAHDLETRVGITEKEMAPFDR